MIKFLDLKAYNAQFHAEFEASFSKLLDSGWYILGEEVRRFETNFAAYCGTTYCIGTANGLDALTLILKGYIELGQLSKGDEVIVPANTYIASILSIIHAGLMPVLVEPDDEAFNIDPTRIKEAISWKTKAIMVVHLYGQLAQMDEVKAIAKEQDLLVIEDAAQAHGARTKDGIKAGNLSDAAAFSFYPSKNLGALGDAGCITTNNKELAEMVAKMRNYGAASKYVNELIGVNSRLDEIQAMFLNIKLKRLDEDNATRQEIAKRYSEGIINEKIRLPQCDFTGEHVFHQYVIRVDDRESFTSFLEKHEIGYLIHYPIAPHKQMALAMYNHLNFPITETIHRTVVSLPLNPILTKSEVSKIIDCLNTY